MKCRHCCSELTLPFADLGTAPPSNAYLRKDQLLMPEKWFPLRVFTCTECWLVQTEDYAQHAELFDAEYAYFSSFSQSWLQHAEAYVKRMVERFSLSDSSHVVEVAANDGYLLQYVKARSIPCLGIEPTASTAAAARDKGIEVIEEFFGIESAAQLVRQGKAADLTVANNVLAHVPDINDFLAGFALLLKPQGVATFEFPHLMQLVMHGQFDTIYHEHFSYLSLTAVRRVLEKNGLSIFDVEELQTHGGSLRLYAQRTDHGDKEVCSSVSALLERERELGMASPSYYRNFQQRAETIKNEFVSFLIDAKRKGKSVAGYGAAAKGNTLMNYAGIRSDLLSFVADRNPAKQNKFMPGSRIPILDEHHIRTERPDYVVLLPWNLAPELKKQLSYVNEWGGKLVTAMPEMRFL
jgi:predicted TPR repeat methyltransferase